MMDEEPVVYSPPEQPDSTDNQEPNGSPEKVEGSKGINPISAGTCL